jgi:CRP-like cAMP-binding protein
VSEQRRPGVLAPGNYFGEVAMLRGTPRSATVVAEAHTRLLVVPRTGFVHASHGDVQATELAIESVRAYQDLA